MKLKTPRIKALYWDVETSTMDVLVRTYRLKMYEKYLRHSDIIREWTMLGAAWSWIDEKKVHSVAVDPADPLNDKEVIRQLREALLEADCLIGHNSDSFDLKMFNTRCVFHGFDPLPKIKTIDTIKIARSQFSFASNSMAYIARYLGCESKGQSPDWDKVLAGCAKEIKKMVKYNINDIVTGKELYFKLRAFMPTHPDFNVLAGRKGELLCRACLSENIQRRGFSKLIPGKKQRYQCNDCGTWTTDSKYYKESDPLVVASASTSVVK